MGRAIRPSRTPSLSHCLEIHWGGTGPWTPESRVRIELGASDGELWKVRGKVRGEEREEWARCKSSDEEVPRLPPPSIRTLPESATDCKIR